MNTKTWTGILSHVCGAIYISLLPAFPDILQKNGANLRSSCPHWPLLCTAAFLLHFHQNPISPHSPEAHPHPHPHPLWNSTPHSSILACIWWMAAPQVLSACPSSPAIKTLGMTNIPLSSPLPHSTSPCPPCHPFTLRPPPLQPSGPSPF